MTRRSTKRRESTLQRTQLRRQRRFEQLEARRLLTTIQWENRGSSDNDSDGFNAAFEGYADTARQLVDQAISDWQGVIRSSPATDNFSLRIQSADLAETNPFSQCGSEDDDLSSILAYACHPGNDIVDQVPVAANLAIDNNAANNDWYFGFGDDPGYDFYSVVAHELGHAMGISTDSRLRISNHLGTASDDPQEEGAKLREFNHDGVTATFTTSGGGHLYETEHAHDLLNPGCAGSLVSRKFISDLDAQVLEAAYGYEVTLPSSEGAQADLQDGLLTVLGTEGNDDFAFLIDGEQLVWQVSGQERARFEADSVDKVHVYLKGGDDVLSVGAGVVAVFGVDGGAGDDTITTGQGDDFLVGGDGNDSLSGGAGSDRLYGGADVDTLIGGKGNDIYTFTAFASLDIVIEYAQEGIDRLDYASLGAEFSVAADILAGVGFDGLPDDWFVGAKYMSGGQDRGGIIFFNGMSANVEDITGGQGSDTLVGNDAANVLRGGGGSDNLTGGLGNDRLYGDAGSDVIRGGDGADYLYGGADSDQLFGDDGADYLNGGQDGSRDTLTGGAGADIFVRPYALVRSYYYTFRRIPYWNSFTRRLTYLYIPQRIYYYTYSSEDFVADSSSTDGDIVRSW